MYFLTNKEGLIIAASNDFLTTIGTREICSISSMIHNQLIMLKDDKLEIPAKDLKYDCSISTMYSAFGELKLYSLKEIEQKAEDEDITYLKQLKSGKIEKDDNEYSIPEIPTLHKESDEIKKELTEENKEQIDINLNEDLNSDIKEKDIKEVSIKLEELNDKKDELNKNFIEQRSSNDKELELQEKLSDNLKELDISIENDKEKKAEIEIKEEDNKEKAEELISIDEDRLKLIQEIEQIASEEKEDTKEPFNTLELNSTDKLAEETIKENKIAKDLNSNNEAINLIQEPKEDNHFVESFEVKEESIENILNLDESAKEEQKEEDKGLKKITKKLFPWSKKDSEIELEDKDYEIDLKPAKELETAQKEAEELPVIDKEKSIEVEEIKAIEADEEEKLKTIDVDDNEAVINTNEELHTQVSEVESIKENKDVIDRSKDSQIVYKLIGIQVKSIDFKKNADKLSIDISSYKMLVENYLDEIEKYNNELLDGSLSTINMLADAGELLSLDILTQKLNKLKDSEDRVSVLKEISLISSLLREKLEDKKEETFNNESANLIDEVKEEVKTEPVSVSPKEIIDITSAEALLKEIEKEEVDFDPQRAVEELNLPKKLIIEFVQDFVAQSKEHLPVMVEAYKNGDIQTIQTTAHMLKGAASNLRLDKIAENLFKIQKENSLDRSGDLIKDFVAKLKGLEEALAAMENVNDED